MRDLGTDDLSTLRHVHQSQHEESLQHRISIHAAFSLFAAGLMAILGGALAASSISCATRCFASLAVVFVCIAAISFMRQQRAKTDEAMRILRLIERRLDLYEEGRFVPDGTLLPRAYETEPHHPLCGLTCGDLLQAGMLVMLTLFILAVLFAA